MNETTNVTCKKFPRSCSWAVLPAFFLAGCLAIAACGKDSSPATPVPSPDSAPEPEARPPGVPTNLHVSSSGADFIEWSWDAVAGAEGYDVQFSAGESFDAQDDVISRNADQTFYRRHPLPTGTNAYLRVRAVAGAGESRLTSDWSMGLAGMAATPRTGRAHFFTCNQASPFQWFVVPGDVLALEWTVSFEGFPDGAFVKEGTTVLREKEWNEYVVTEKADKTAGMAKIYNAAGSVCSRLRFAVGLDPRRDQFSSSPDCEATRVLGLGYGARLVNDWNPDSPFRFEFDAEGISAGGVRIGRPNFLEEEVLQPLRDVANRIEARLGYRVIEPDGPPTDVVIGIRTRDEPGTPGWGTPECPEWAGSPMNAHLGEALITFNRHFFNPEVSCQGYRGDRESETVIHELAHVLGMKHASEAGDRDSEKTHGVPMSVPLTFHKRHGDSDAFFTDADIDAIGCIFPHPDHPR